MNCEIDRKTLELKEHRFGRFDKRMPIGPVQWTFHDLLWIHEGKAIIEFPASGAKVELMAPAGILILPNTSFSGQALGAFATASICHFTCGTSKNPAFLSPGYMLPNDSERLHIQNLVRLAMHLARQDRSTDMGRRQRLLHAILDGFQFENNSTAPHASSDGDRLTEVWELASQNLDKMRTLSDVAGLLGINESGFRALHRKAWQTSAGEHLRELRLKRAEGLLATTGFSLGEIASQIGYAHAETLSAAFKKTRGKTPGQYRRWSNPFA